MTSDAAAVTTREPEDESAPLIEVAPLFGDALTITVRGHRWIVDQPHEEGGSDLGPMPTEVFVAALTACVAHYAGRFLDRHGFPRTGLRVTADSALADDRPARVSSIRLRITVPPTLPDARRAALLAVASHCTAHNTMRNPPQIDISLT